MGDPYSAMRLRIFCLIIFALWLNNIIVSARFHFHFGRRGQCARMISVLDYGAVGDGFTDDSKAFLKTWEQVCNGANEGVVYHVAKDKTFLLKPIEFQGPCKSSSVRIQIDGNLNAPKTTEDWSNCDDIRSWINFKDIQGLDISGSGQLDGQGSSWWSKSTSENKCTSPTALRFHNCTDVGLQGLTHLNSPKNHISVNECHNVELSELQITAPQDSPNTDGIDISSSTNVHVHHSRIGSGDDCIAINGGSSYITIDGIVCGPGHGISVGSLGKDGAYDTVAAVLVKNCSFTETKNGARIKTWEGGSGYARNITFEDITFQNTYNPIIIDQHYIDKHINSDGEKSAVEVSNVMYRNMQGTSASENGISFLCSEDVPCKSITIDKVSITSGNSGQLAKTVTQNAQVTFVDSSH